MKTVRFTTRFPSASHPVYAEIQNNDGQIVYWNAFQNVSEMESFLRRMFYNEIVIFKRMKGA